VLFGVQRVLAIHGSKKDIAWVFTREWALFIHAAKICTWVLTWEWALVRDNTVLASSLCNMIDRRLLARRFTLTGSGKSAQNHVLDKQ
jgi:hypothetical protein